MARYVDVESKAFDDFIYDHCCDPYYDSIMKNVKELQSVDAAPQWISVKEWLPEPLHHVVALARTKDKRIQIGVAEWDGKRWFSTQIYCDQDDIKYFMPLPEPPKEEEDG